jgi:hypothetical protein
MRKTDEAAIAQVLQALTEVCTEDARASIPSYVTRTDAAMVGYGPMTHEVAAAVDGMSLERVKRTLDTLNYHQQVLRSPKGDARGSTVRWWPVGLAASLSE